MSFERSNSECVTSAQIRTTSPFASIVFSSESPPMSTRRAGDDSRMLSEGMRLCPPASALAPGRASSENASARLAGLA